MNFSMRVQLPDMISFKLISIHTHWRLQVMKAFETADKIRGLFHDPASGELLSDVSGSPLLTRTLHTRFPPLRPLLSFFQRAFNAEEAKKGQLTPAAGVDPRYDSAVAEIKQVEGE